MLFFYSMHNTSLHHLGILLEAGTRVFRIIERGANNDSAHIQGFGTLLAYSIKHVINALRFKFIASLIRPPNIFVDCDIRD